MKKLMVLLCESDWCTIRLGEERLSLRKAEFVFEFDSPRSCYGTQNISLSDISQCSRLWCTLNENQVEIKVMNVQRYLAPPTNQRRTNNSNASFRVTH